MATRVRSFSKINLGLAVGPARGDGFHGLTTVYQTLGLHDFVTVSARRAAETRITLTANHAGVPRTETGDAERNTAWKMVAGALARLGIAAEVAIDIDKRLPVQGGMGAGSANAVAALLGLERELGVALAGVERLKLAAEVGSDVPLFLLGGTVLGLGRGEEVYPLPDLPAVACVVAVPEVGVSTGLAFKVLDERMIAAPNPGLKGETWGTRSGGGSGGLLTFAQPVDRLRELSRALAAVWMTTGAEHDSSGITWASDKDGGATLEEGVSGKSESKRLVGDLAEKSLLALVRTGIENDFEEVVFSQHPSLRHIKRELLGSETNGCALYACLSGSGSALFGLYRSQADARAAQQRVTAAGTRALLTETLTRTGYWDTVFAE